MTRKTFFKQESVAEIRKKELVLEGTGGNILDIAALDSEQYVVLQDNIIPRGFESGRKFMKHGPEVKPKRYYSLEQSVKEARTPVQLREEAFDSLDPDLRYCGYTFMPVGRDRRKRKVSLVECLEGARLFAYSNQVPGTEIRVKPYDDSKRVRIEGAEVIVSVPSRTEGERRQTFKLISIPVVDSPEKYTVSLNFGSDHSCGSKRFNIRYKYTDDKESSGIVNVCAHEIAGYLQLIEHYKDQYNIVPLQMSQFAIPSQETVHLYQKLENNVLVKDTDIKSNLGLRHPNMAEKEIILWELVKEIGHDRTFYSRASRDGNVAEYDWGK